MIESTIVYALIAAAFTLWWLNSDAKTYSMSYYDIRSGYEALFTLACWGLAIPGMIVFNTPLMIIGAIGLLFVGLASDFVVRKAYEVVMPDGSYVEKERRVKGIVYWMHMGGTYVCVGFSQASLWIEHGLWFLTVAFIGASIAVLLRGSYRKLGWVELFAIITTLNGMVLIQI